MKYLEEKDMNIKKATITQSPIKLDKYDMYYIKFPMKDGTKKRTRVFCNKDTVPNFKSDEFKDLKKNHGKEIGKFFVRNLLGPDGLMAKEGRTDYIFLGEEERAKRV